jgi:osmotically-inducible protein OsmY
VARVYTTPDSQTEVTAQPAGAKSQDWQLAEEIRGLLTADPKLGNAPMAAVVNNGVVTLRGGVRNEKDRERLKQQIGALPGVQRVDDEMEFKNPQHVGTGESKSY